MKESALTKASRAAAPPPYEVQAFGTVADMPIALAEPARREGSDNLNQLLADTITLRDLYRKHHWQARPGRPFIGSICCSISTTASRTRWWTPSLSGSCNSAV